MVLHSYMGMILTFPWETGFWPVIVTCGVVLGKATGGFLGDRIGMQKAAALSLGLTALCFLFSGFPVCGTLAVLFLNMSVPMTLWVAAQWLPGGKGFAFGTLKFALFLGFLPVLFGAPVLLSSGAGYALAAAVSAVLFVAGLKKGDLR